MLADKVVPPEKTCRKCGLTKTSSEFRFRAKSPDGLRGECKACKSAMDAEWARRNADRKAAKDAAYYVANKDAHNARCAAYYVANKSLRNAGIRAYREANTDAIREQKRQARLANVEARRAARREHYRANKSRYVANARRRELDQIQRTPPWADLEEISAFYDEAARLTKETGIVHHVDHVIPLRGKFVSGLHVANNLQILTAKANLEKGNAFPG